MSPKIESRHKGDTLTIFLARFPQVTFVRWCWYACDGFSYSRTLGVKQCQILAKDSRYLSIHVSSIGGLANAQSIDSNFASPIGKMKLFPEWTSLYLLNATHAAVQCITSEDVALYPRLNLASPTQRCPRSCLQRVLETARKSYGIIFLAGFETEFYLLKETLLPLNFDEGASIASLATLKDMFPLWSSAASMRGPEAKCVENCMLALEMAGVVVEQAHSESSANQYEIPTGPLPVLEAIDAVMCTREIISETALSCGFRAIFIPKPFPNLRPTVLHLHLSIHGIERSRDLGIEDDIQENIENATPLQPPQIQITEESYRIPLSQEKVNSFLAGILKRLVPLCAFSRGSHNSYLPSPTPSTTGDYVAWGLKNSSVPLNEVSLGHWEIRTLDWTTNIYLAAAAYISAGLLGVQNKEILSWKDPQNLVGRLNSETRKDLGIVEEMPTTYEEAFQSLIDREYVGLQEIMGEEIIDLFVLVKQKGGEFVKSLTDEQRMSLYLLHF